MNTEAAQKLRSDNSAVFLYPLFLSLGLLVLYLTMQATSIYGGDSGELVSAAYTFGIAHPPGYPLYTFLAGLLSHSIPFKTVAWRVGLLSSVPMALSVYFVWLIIYRLTKSIFTSSISSLFYALLYPVWLYGIVAEVFGLYAMFTASYLYVFIRWVDTKQNKLLYTLAVLTGVSFTHQYLILLLIVSVVFVIQRYDKSSWQFIKQKKLSLLFAFGFGLIPLIYAPIASLFNPPFDREHAANIVGFLRLISRISTGGFRASSVATGGIFNGLADVVTFTQYLYKDFTLLGIVLVGVGLFWLWKKEKLLFSLFLVYIFLLIFYLFYAGFPVFNNFQLGTLERFFIVPYQTFAILLGVGLSFLRQIYERRLLSGQKIYHTVFLLFSYVFWVLILFFLLVPFKNNYKTLLLLENDRTMENYAQDILRSIPQGAIYGIYQDTTFGAVNYAFYVLRERQDVIYINYYLLSRPYYRQQIKSRYPDVIIPNYDSMMTINDYITNFITQNEKHKLVTSDVELPNILGYWVPSGLVNIHYSKIEDIPNRLLILDKNKSLWQTFSDPLFGSLGQYKHLLLSDVLRLYADHALSLAQGYEVVGNYTESQKFMEYALAHEINVRVDQYKPYVDFLMEKKECTLVRQTLDMYNKKWGEDFVILEGYHNLMKKCSLDDENLKLFESKYQKLKPSYDEALK